MFLETDTISGSNDEEVQQQNVIKVIDSELRVQLVLTKLHLGEQLLARVSAAKHCDHTLGTGQQHRKLSMWQLTLEVYESSGRSKFGQKNVRSLQLNQLQLHIRGGVVIGKVKRSADDLELE